MRQLALINFIYSFNGLAFSVAPSKYAFGWLYMIGDLAE